MTVSHRWLIVTVVCAVLALIAGGALLYVEERIRLRRNVENDLEFIAKLKMNQIAQWRKEKLADAALIAENPILSKAVRQLLVKPVKELTQDVSKWFQSMKSRYHYADVTLVDRKGQVRLSTSSPSQELHEPAVRALERAFREKRPVLSELHACPRAAVPHIDAVAPVFETQGNKKQPVGAVLLRIDAAQFLYPLIQFWPTPSRSAETLLVRRDGDSALFLNELRHRKNTALKLRIPLTAKDVPAVMAIEGKKGVVQGLDYRGVEVLSVINPVPHSPWFMIAKVDKAEALAVWRLRSVLIAFSLLAATISFIAIASLIWQRNAKTNYRALYEKEAALRQVEERYQATLLSVGDGVIATNSEGRVELMNPVAEALTGWGHEEANGKPLEDIFRIISEKTREQVENPVTQVMREGSVVGLANHTLLIARDGTERPIADSGAPIRDQDGVVTGTVLIFRDQTAERVSRRELEEKEQLLESTGRMARVGGWEVDADSLEVRWTAETYRIHEVPLGYKPPLEEAINFFHEEDRPKLRRAIENALQQGTPYDMEIRFITAKGKHLWTRIMCEPEIVDGRTIRLRGTFQDITEQKLTELELTESQRRLSTLMGNLPGIVFRCFNRQSWTMEFVSKGCLEITGYTPDDLVGDKTVSYGDLIIPQDRDRVWNEIQDAIADSRAYELEYRIRSRSGQERWIWEKGIGVTSEGTGETVLEGFISDVTDRKLVEQSLRESEQRYRAVVNNLQVGISIINRDMEIVDVNPFYKKYFPHMRPSHHQRCYEAFHDPSRSTVCPYCPCVLAFQDGLVHECETETPIADKIRNYRLISCPIVNERGDVDLVIELFEDITERKSLQAQLAHAQKMESIGTLAGGIAHDFNNILTIIQGYSEMVLSDKSEDHPDYADLSAVNGAAQRGADLVKQLLTFSRKVETDLRPLNLNQEVQTAVKLLSRTIPKMIDIHLHLAPDVHRINADPGQMEQVILNLAVNATHAMPDGGTLTFESGNITLDDDYCKTHPEAVPGEYSYLKVEDTGHGMSHEMLLRIFEPFFSTKEPGQGTGLGLAMVYGIVKNHRGHIVCYSEPGLGTTFQIYLPALEDEIFEGEVNIDRELPGGSETILLVDDEAMIRNLGKKLLEQAGYTVMEAGNGEEALEIYSNRGQEIDLVVLDLIMPSMGGYQTLMELQNIDSEVCVVIASGYSPDGLAKTSIESGAAAFVAKPFMRRNLLRTVREVLDR